MDKVVTTYYDVAEHLRTPEEMAAYLEACLEEANGDIEFIAKALRDIARAKNMLQIGGNNELSNENNFDFSTIFKVIKNLGLKLNVTVSHV
jgi:probable addiction module antidote protein